MSIHAPSLPSLSVPETPAVARELASTLADAADNVADAAGSVIRSASRGRLNPRRHTRSRTPWLLGAAAVVVLLLALVGRRVAAGRGRTAAAQRSEPASDRRGTNGQDDTVDVHTADDRVPAALVD